MPLLSNSAEVLWVARYDYPVGWKMTFHQHDYYQMVYIVEGDADYLIETTLHPVNTASIIFFKPFENHMIKTIRKGTIKTLDIKFQLHDADLARAMQNVQAVTTMTYGDPAALLLKIRNEGMVKRPYFQTMSNALLVELLLTVLQNHEIHSTNLPQDTPPVSEPHINLSMAQDSSNHLAEKVMDHIASHYSEDLSLDIIAKFLGYHANYISQVFKQASGTTPMRYLYQYRVDRAKDLIRFSDFGFKEITKMTGFKTVQHFSRCFQEIMGMSPGQWRNKEKEGIGKGVFISENFTNSDFLKKEN